MLGRIACQFRRARAFSYHLHLLSADYVPLEQDATGLAMSLVWRERPGGDESPSPLMLLPASVSAILVPPG